MTDFVLDSGLEVLALAEIDSNDTLLEVLSLDLVGFAGDLQKRET